MVLSFDLGADDTTVSEPILIVGAHLEGRLDGTETAGYDQLIKIILPTDGSTEFQRMPLVRAIRTFAEEKHVCLFPTSVSAVESIAAIQDADFLQSAAIDLVTSHFMTSKQQPRINSFEDIRGLRIAVQRGVAAGALSKSPFKPVLVATPDDTIAFRMMQAGRVDGFYGWNPDALIIAEREGTELPNFNPDFIIFETTTHLVCKSNIGAEPVIAFVDKKIETLRSSGALRAILGPYARITGN